MAKPGGGRSGRVALGMQDWDQSVEVLNEATLQLKDVGRSPVALPIYICLRSHFSLELKNVRLQGVMFMTSMMYLHLEVKTKQ